MRLIDADDLIRQVVKKLHITNSFKDITDLIDKAPTVEPNKSRPYGNCAECIHRYGTLGCCSTVNNEWVYDCDNGMAQYKINTAEPKWIPVSERLPKENEHVGNVYKYYLIQDEYGDMHVAHLSGRGWEPIESIKALGCDVLAWMPLPKPYREEGE